MFGFRESYKASAARAATIVSAVFAALASFVRTPQNPTHSGKRPVMHGVYRSSSMVDRSIIATMPLIIEDEHSSFEIDRSIIEIERSLSLLTVSFSMIDRSSSMSERPSSMIGRSSFVIRRSFSMVERSATRRRPSRAPGNRGRDPVERGRIRAA
jgi:hypothetical protein